MALNTTKAVVGNPASNPSQAIPASNPAIAAVAAPASDSTVDTSNPWNSSLSSGDQGLISNQLAQAYGDIGSNQYSDQVTSGISSTGKGLLRSPEQIDQNLNSLGMSEPSDFADTISKRTNGYYQDAVNQIKTTAHQNAPLYASQIMQQQTQNLQQNEGLRLANYKLANQQYEQTIAMQIAQQQAQNGVISAILGIGGAVVGGLIGGPMGALTGGAAGAGLGKAATAGNTGMK